MNTMHSFGSNKHRGWRGWEVHGGRDALHYEVYKHMPEAPAIVQQHRGQASNIIYTIRTMQTVSMARGVPNSSNQQAVLTLKPARAPPFAASGQHQQ
jgi:hypothetical protein